MSQNGENGGLFPEILKTGRLILRKPRIEDVHGVHEYASDPEATRFMGWPTHETPGDTLGFLVMTGEMWTGGGSFPYIIAPAEDESRVMGMITPQVLKNGITRDGRRGVTVAFGYILGRPYWRRGVMREALLAVINVAETTGAHRLQAMCDVENIPSSQLLSACGFVHEGRLRRYFLHPQLSDIPRDVDMYARMV